MTALQLTDDNDLLRVLAADQGAAPTAYQPVIYWAGYQKKVIERLASGGLTDIRRQTASEFIGFVPNDNGYTRDAARTIQNFASINDAQKQQLFNLVVAACINPGLGILPFGLSVSDIERLAFRYCDCIGRLNGAIPPGKGWDSCAGNPQRHFMIDGKAYTYEWLRYYFIYAYFSRFVDFSRIANIVEVGPGLGMQAEVIRKMHPHIRYYLLDNAAQAYVCHQYMDAVFGGALVDYRALRERQQVTLQDPGAIAVLGNWQVDCVRPTGTTLFWSCATLCSMSKDCFSAYREFMQSIPEALCLVEHAEGMKKAAPGERHDDLLDPDGIVAALDRDFECVARAPLDTPLNRQVDSAGGSENLCLIRRGASRPLARSIQGETS